MPHVRRHAERSPHLNKSNIRADPIPVKRGRQRATRPPKQLRSFRDGQLFFAQPAPEQTRPLGEFRPEVPTVISHLANLPCNRFPVKLVFIGLTPVPDDVIEPGCKSTNRTDRPAPHGARTLAPPSAA